MKIRRLTLFVACLLAVLPVLEAADPPSEWRNIQSVQVSKTGLVKLSLPAQTLDAARPGLEDLRILDDTNQEMPYLIDRPVQAEKVVRSAKSFAVSLAPESTVITVATGLTQPLDAVTLETVAPQFIKAVQVEGSENSKEWRILTHGLPVFRQPYGASQLRLPIPVGIWPFLRLTVDDRRAEAVVFTGARVHAAASEPAPAEPLPIRIVERTENEGQTRLTLDLGAGRLTVGSLQIETPEPLFMRSVTLAVRQITENDISERTIGAGTIYRVALEDQAVSSELKLPLDAQVPTRELLLLIANHDNQPLQITSVRAQRRPVYAIFFAQQGGGYRILTGNPYCSAPRYDVSAFGPNLKAAPVSTLQLTEPSPNPSYHPREPLPEVQDLGTSLAVADWKYRKRVRLGRVGVQQLELDLETLSHATADFRDLRLVRGGKQRPYILERTSITRKLVPQVQTASDPKRPSVSRWIIKLPNRMLPLTRLTSTSSTSLFKRQVALYEQPTDERGEKFQRTLGQATWVRKPSAITVPMELLLFVSPTTDTLIVETDNGDNPPIELADFQLYYPVTRVLFKAPLEPETFLYYGNRATGWPQYDIELVAPQMLVAEKTNATLDTEEQLAKGSWTGAFQVSRIQNIIFWIALAAVVLVLLVVISRLLPKPPPPEA